MLVVIKSESLLLATIEDPLRMFSKSCLDFITLQVNCLARLAGHINRCGCKYGNSTKELYEKLLTRGLVSPRISDITIFSTPKPFCPPTIIKRTGGIRR